MKFSSSLKFNAVAEWWDDYIAYEALKKHIYQLEKQKAGLHEAYHDLEANESTSLMTGGRSSLDLGNTDAIFLPLLDRELRKICVFYETEEQRLTEDLATLQTDIERQEESGPDAGLRYLDEEGDEDDDEDEDYQLQSPTATLNRDRTQSPSRRRKSSRSMSSTGARGVRTRVDQIFRRHSISSDEPDDIEASTASLDPNAGPSNAGAGRGNSRSPLVKARAIARTLKDSIMSVNSQPGQGETVWTARNNYSWDVQLLFKRKITNIYVLATSLKSYIELNYSGFRKILKKYDKVMDGNVQDRYLHTVVEQAVPFQQITKDKLNTKIALLIDLYALCVTHNDAVEARRQLKLHQREHIAWERDTVWRQMIGQARRGEEGGLMTMGGIPIVAFFSTMEGAQEGRLRAVPLDGHFHRHGRHRARERRDEQRPARGPRGRDPRHDLGHGSVPRCFAAVGHRARHLDIHQPHYCLCAPCADRQGGGQEYAGRGLFESAHLHHRSHLLDRHGDARLRLPQPDCRDAGRRNGTAILVERGFPQERRPCEYHIHDGAHTNDIDTAQSTRISANLHKRFYPNGLRLRPGKDRVVRQGNGWVVEGGSPYGSFANMPLSGTFNSPQPSPSPCSPSFGSANAPQPGTTSRSASYGLGLGPSPGVRGSSLLPPHTTVSPFPTAATVGTPYTASHAVGMPSAPGTPNLYSHFPPMPTPGSATGLGSVFAHQQGGGPPPPPRGSN